MSANPALFDHLKSCAERLRRRYGTIGSDPFPRILQALEAEATAYIANGGEWVSKTQARDVARSVARFEANRGRTKFRGPNGQIFQGKGVRPERPNATIAARQSLGSWAEALLETNRSSAPDPQDDPSDARLKAIRGRGVDGHLSARQFLDSLREFGSANGSTRYDEISLKAASTAVASVLGRPKRDRRIAALSRLARDVAWLVEESFPKATYSVVHWSQFAERIWPAALHANGKAVHRHRILKALAEMDAAGVGLSAYAGKDGMILIGRMKGIPDEGAQAIMDAVIERRGQKSFPGPIVPTRRGLWGSQEGLEAQSVVNVTGDDNNRIEGHVFQRLTGVYHVEDPNGLENALEDLVREFRALAHEQDLSAVWRRVADMPVLASRAKTDAPRIRIATIEDRLTGLHTSTEMQRMIETDVPRIGRPRTKPADRVPMKRAPQPPMPAPIPEAIPALPRPETIEPYVPPVLRPLPAGLPKPSCASERYDGRRTMAEPWDSKVTYGKQSGADHETRMAMVEAYRAAQGDEDAVVALFEAWSAKGGLVDGPFDASERELDFALFKACRHVVMLRDMRLADEVAERVLAKGAHRLLWRPDDRNIVTAARVRWQHAELVA